MDLDSEFHVARDDKWLGIMRGEEIVSKLQEGSLMPWDICWQQGMTGWQAVENLFLLPAPGAAIPSPLDAPILEHGAPLPLERGRPLADTEMDEPSAMHPPAEAEDMGVEEPPNEAAQDTSPNELHLSETPLIPPTELRSPPVEMLRQAAPSSPAGTGFPKVNLFKSATSLPKPPPLPPTAGSSHRPPPLPPVGPPPGAPPLPPTAGSSHWPPPLSAVGPPPGAPPLPPTAGSSHRPPPLSPVGPPPGAPPLPTSNGTTFLPPSHAAMEPSKPRGSFTISPLNQKILLALTAALVITGLGWGITWFFGTERVYQQALALRVGKPARFDAAAVEHLQKAALRGHPAAQADLGWSLLRGEGIQRDLASAAIWLETAAKAGDAYGQAGYGWALKYGLGCSVNEKEARRWIEASAAQEHAEGLNLLAIEMDSQGDRESSAMFLKAKMAGSKAAAAEMAYISRLDSLKADGTVHEEKAAAILEELRVLAEDGCYEAQFIIALCLSERTFGDEPRPEEAMEWLKRATALGDWMSEVELCELEFEVGQQTQAMERLSSLADAHVPDALRLMLDFYSARWELGREDSTAVLSWAQKAADYGTAFDRTRLGHFYYEGKCGVKVNASQAFHWLSIAAEEEEKSAMFWLGKMLEDFSDQLTESQKARALEMATKSLQQGYPESVCYKVMKMIENAADPSATLMPDELAALEKLEKLQLYHSSAQLTASQLYLRGLFGYPKDEDKAYELLLLASNADDFSSEVQKYLVQNVNRWSPSKLPTMIAWTEKLAQQKDPVAYLLLARMYARHPEISRPIRTLTLAWALVSRKFPPPNIGKLKGKPLSDLEMLAARAGLEREDILEAERLARQVAVEDFREIILSR